MASTDEAPIEAQSTKQKTELSDEEKRSSIKGEKIDRLLRNLSYRQRRLRDLFFYEEVENEKRGNWSGKLDFLLSCLGYAVGLGNFWRFPYLCYKSGGGAFFIPYLLCLICVGIPVFLVEITLGQFTSAGPVMCFDFAPLFRGLGFALVSVAAMVSIYYNVIIGWSVWYFFASFQSPLPWKTCRKPWASDLCKTFLNEVIESRCIRQLRPFPNGTCYNMTSGKLYGLYNLTLASENNIRAILPADDFLKRKSLQFALSPGIHDIGPVRWDMSLALLFAWILVFLSIFKGIKSSGKVVYFTAIFPYFVLFVLFCKGVTLPGCGNGLKYFFLPKVERLKDATVWRDAASQVFFSLSLCEGGLTTLASYNRFHNHVVRDTFFVTIGNGLTSLFAGIVVFSYLGAFAKANGVDVDSVAEGGAGLAFVVYPQAISTLPFATAWALIFFLMLITLGLDSEFTLMEAVITAIVDYFKIDNKFRVLVVAGVCFTGFLFSLSMACPGGGAVVTLLDDYSCGWVVFILAIILTTSINVYGVKRFAEDIKVMIPIPHTFGIHWDYLKWYFIAAWKVLSPAVLIFVLIFSLVGWKPSSFNGKAMPMWANAIGFLITIFIILLCFIFMVIDFIRMHGTCKQRMKTLLKPKPTWGPALPQFRKLITYAPVSEINAPVSEINPEA